MLSHFILRRQASTLLLQPPSLSMIFIYLLCHQHPLNLRDCWKPEDYLFGIRFVLYRYETPESAQNHLGNDSTRPLESTPTKEHINAQIAQEPPQMF